MIKWFYYQIQHKEQILAYNLFLQLLIKIHEKLYM
jgi:hypothetical protein